MKLIQRIGYYLGGFSLGLIILTFFFSKKKTSCSYGPEARVIKNINSKKILYSNDIKNTMYSQNLDSSEVLLILKKGDINFSESNSRQKPCGIYIIEGDFNNQEIILTVENCDSIATLLNMKVN